MNAQELPLFYRRPRPMRPELDGGKSLAPASGYAFTAAANSVPLNAVEFTLACKHYPIVFTSGPQPVPLALLGLRKAENLFVDAAGQWAAGAYVPAYVRRYPFVFMENPQREQLVLCIDEAAEMIVEGDQAPLFRDGQPSELTRKAMEFCREFQAHHVFTMEFTKALDAAGLLADNRADVTLKSGERMAVGGFRVIDEAKFNALPDETFLEWRRRGWLHLVYCHLLSVSNWGGLVDRLAERQARA